MTDPLLDEIAGLFRHDVPPPVLAPHPTGLEPMQAVHEPVRGPSRQLVFHVGAGRMYLQLDPAPAGLRLTGVLDDKGVSVEVRSPGSTQALHPDAEKKQPHVRQVLAGTKGPIVATSDYMRALPEQVANYLDGRLLALGTDGFGRSETRKALRRFFEIDAEHVAVAALYALAERGELDRAAVAKAAKDLGIDPDAPAPWAV